MQLKKKSNFSKAATTLLGATLSVSAVAEDAQWSNTISTLYYSESDSRVDDFALQLKSTRTTESEKTFSLNLGVDSLTGASPSGRVNADGSGGFRLSNLEDTRYSAALSYSQRLGSSFIGSAGITASDENDYSHFGVNFGLQKEVNQKNTVFSIGVARSADSIDAVSGNRTPGVSTSRAFRIGEQDKDVTDIVFGWTQIYSKNTITQMNYSYSNSSGYLNDPYKVVSIIDNQGRPVDTIVEKRPEDRTGHSIYAALNRKYFWGVFKPSFRYYTDDWGIDSTTFELRFNKPLSNNHEIEPYIRYYSQSKADFYRAQISTNEILPDELSSDYRLSEFDALTIGVAYRWKGNNDRKYSLGFDYYKQNPATPSDQLDGQNDLNPGIEAIMLRFSITF